MSRISPPLVLHYLPPRQQLLSASSRPSIVNYEVPPHFLADFVLPSRLILFSLCLSFSPLSLPFCYLPVPEVGSSSPLPSTLPLDMLALLSTSSDPGIPLPSPNLGSSSPFVHMVPNRTEHMLCTKGWRNEKAYCHYSGGDF